MLHDGMHDGWCDDCETQTVVVDRDTASGNAWATCTECGVGWIHRDESPEQRVDEQWVDGQRVEGQRVVAQPAERRAA